MIGLYKSMFELSDVTRQAALAGDVREFRHYKDGRVEGYVAKNGQRIHDLPFDFRVPIEPNFDEYANPSRIELEDGYTFAGLVPWKDGHPSGELSPEEAGAHYNDPSRAVAIVRYGQDDIGIWAAGVLMPGISEEARTRVEMFPVSGDWRMRSKRWRFIGACLVVVPGLPTRAVASLDGLSITAQCVGRECSCEYEMESREQVLADLAELSAQMVDKT